MLEFLCHPHSLPPVGPHLSDQKMAALIKKAAFVLVLRMDLFDIAMSGIEAIRNPTATSLARKNDNKWRIGYSKLPKDKRLAALKALALAQVAPQPALSDDEEGGDFLMGQKASKEILADLAVETGATSGGENEPSGGDEGDDDDEGMGFGRGIGGPPGIAPLPGVGGPRPGAQGVSPDAKERPYWRFIIQFAYRPELDGAEGGSTEGAEAADAASADSE